MLKQFSFLSKTGQPWINEVTLCVGTKLWVWGKYVAIQTMPLLIAKCQQQAARVLFHCIIVNKISFFHGPIGKNDPLIGCGWLTMLYIPQWELHYGNELP